MPFDALHLNILSKEFATSLTGGRIDRITTPNFYSVRFAIYSNKKTYGLLLNLTPNTAHARLTNGARDELATVSVFLTHLKKHLIGGVIDDVGVVENERILRINVKSYNEVKQLRTFTLVAEFMGKHSNLMLVNDEGKISESLKHIPLDMSSKRQVLPGLSYRLPPAQDKISPFDSRNLSELLFNYDSNTKIDLVSVLQKNLCGLAPKTIKEVIFRAFGNAEQKLPLDNRGVELVVGEFKKLEIFTVYSPCISVDTSGKCLDFYFSPYKHTGEVFDYRSTLNEAVDCYYCQCEASEKKATKSRAIEQSVKIALVKAQKRLSILLERELASQNLDEDRIMGELITANIYKIKRGDCVLECDNYYVDPPIAMKIKLDETMPPAKCADKFFRSYQKKKKSLEILVPQLEQANKEIEYLESVLHGLKVAETLDDLGEIAIEFSESGYIKDATNKKAKPTKSKIKTEKEERLAGVKRTEFNGYTILTGKNNLQNDALVRFCAPNDLWLHPQEFRGSHTIILNPKKSLPPDKVIKKAAQITAMYSKAKSGENIPVDYTYLKFVMRPRGAALGKVLYTNQKTLFVSPE